MQRDIWLRVSSRGEYIGVQRVPSPKTFTIYPNPTISTLNINLAQALMHPPTAQLINLQGQVLYNHPLLTVHNTLTLPSGVYLLRLPDEHERILYLVKVVKP